MKHHHSFGKYRLIKKVFALCIAFILICSISIPAFAVGDNGTENDAAQQPAQAATYILDSEGEADSGQSVEDTGKSAEIVPQNDRESDSWSGTENNITEGDSSQETLANDGQKSAASSRTLSDDSGITPLAADDAYYTIQVGDSFKIEATNGNGTWRSSNSQVVTVSGSGRSATVTGESVGTAEITYSYRSGGKTEKQTWTVTVTEASGTIKVYVYVATIDKEGNSWASNAEFLDLLGISADTIDGNGYFPVGEIELDRSFLNGKTAANTQGEPLITSEADWSQLIAALGNLDTSTLTGIYEANRGNHVAEYLSQASKDFNRSWGSQRTALFRWDMSPSYGFEDQTVQYHLDLQFNTNKITFITGNNGITSGTAKDGTTVDSRTYITGSEIQEPRNLTIPDGYRFVGYYEDADFTKPWNGIGTPLNEDQTVYIKITPMDNVIIYYKVAEGEGTLSRDSEGLNPVTGEAAGSTATPTDGYVFDGWYEDEECTKLLSKDADYKPTKQSNERWVDGTTYWAKFVAAVQDITVTKHVAGYLGDVDKEFQFSYKYTDTEGQIQQGSFNVKNNESHTISNIPIGKELELTETNAGGYVTTAKYGDDSVTVTGEKDDDEKNMAITVVNNHQEITVTNSKDVTPDTGLNMSSAPFIVLLGFVVVGAVGFVGCRRSRHFS